MKGVTLLNVSFAQPRAVPVGLLSIAAVLVRDGHRVTVRDHVVKSYRGLDDRAFLASLDGADGVVGVGCMSDTLPFVLHALEAFKREHPRAIVILGGPGPTGIAKEIVETFPFVDVVVRGEGEATMAELMDALRRGDAADLAHVKGICWRRGAEAVTNPARARIADLDALPLPLYEGLPMEQYSLVNVVSSRGCPYHCTFCDVAPLWERKHVRRGAASIVAEMKLLRDRWGKTNFEFTDETFVLRRRAVLEFCDLLRAEGVEASWSCTGRVNLVDEDLLEAMAAGGCRALFFGVESGSDAVLARIRKDFTAGEVVEAMHRTTRRLRAVASFIWGFPFETRGDLIETMLLMVYLSRIGVDTRLNRLAPFPLAPLCREHGATLVEYPEDRAASPLEPFETSILPRDVGALVRRHPRLFPEFYWFGSGDLAEKGRLVAALDRHWLTEGWEFR